MDSHVQNSKEFIIYLVGNTKDSFISMILDCYYLQ
ncbi:unnamed protein product [Brassica oleracea]